MYQLFIDTEACKACGYCITFCPKQALSFSGQRNQQSYPYVRADTAACVLCGICYTVCPDMVFQILPAEEKNGCAVAGRGSI